MSHLNVKKKENKREQAVVGSALWKHFLHYKHQLSRGNTNNFRLRSVHMTSEFDNKGISNYVTDKRREFRDKNALALVHDTLRWHSEYYLYKLVEC